MKILLAGATGVVGRRLTPLLVQAGHEVAGTTRHEARAASVREGGATPVVMDALDAASVRRAVETVRPDAIIHQLTDLSGEDFTANSHLRIKGTRNLVDAALAAGVQTMIAQSAAWLYVAGAAAAVETDPLDPALPPSPGVVALEEAVGEMPRGVVLRYGALYGPGTWYAPDGAIAKRVRAGNLRQTPAWTSFVHADDAAAAALAAVEWPAGAVNIVDDEPATTADWLPVYSASLGAPLPGTARHAAAMGRPVSNAKALSLGWKPQVPSWRTGFAAQR
ncbi:MULTISPECIES: NAD(P)-dependent oxidoreductase [Actinomadura]|uniref:NAD-dependent epimerase/dehydratase family protein n=1 Tax=Actinomadura litoris TaxID=2678616 RepID=A0A7K1LCV7_9ACTN|nr:MULTISPECIES: NAD(P)-dependent oxidoreductase [Actinomadura]MBT2208247.1 NAD(P)-dependent oxidoreductase [Actinomadura sp. NEAU-AAG7]MUN42086.1 NAD-dependent epimerase/dehydratase family protein [Actinomadura litoris]